MPAAVLASAAAALAGRPVPLEAPAERLMEWTPVIVANFLLLHGAGLARPAALLGALALLMLAGGMAGALAAACGKALAARVVGFGLAGLLLLAIFAGAFTPADLTSGVWFIAVYLVLLAVLSQRSPRVPGRRQFLQQTGLILGGALSLILLSTVQPLIQAAAARRLFPYRPPGGLPVSGLTDPVTPVSRFYVMDKVLQYPDVGPPSWRLLIDGEGAALTLDFTALLARVPQHRYITLECVDNPVGGPLISTAFWSGVPVAELLRQVGITADTLVFHAADGYQEAAPRRVIEGVGALIAYAMNGELLPRAHGYPARLVIPGLYGFKSVKWLTRIEAVHGLHAGDWRSHGWTAGGSIHTTTQIDVARRVGDEVLLAGVAFAGSRGIRAVQVRISGGAWREATLGRRLSRECWRQWAVRFRTPGPVTIQVRAVDDAGRIQIGHTQGPYPDGATGWAAVTI